MSWLHALWFFLPAGIANATPVLVSRLPLLKHWNTPLDFGMHRKGRRLLGPNKTVRGLVCGTIIAASVGGILQLLTPSGFKEVTWLLGGLMGFGALTGDAIESIFKRRRGVPSGEKWFPFDQVDYIIGGTLFILPFTNVTLVFALQILVVWFGMHLLFSFIAYKLGLKSKPI